MKKYKVLSIIICLSLLVVALCSCSAEQKFDSAVSKITKRLSSAKTVTKTVTVKDGDTIVYQYVKRAEFNGNEANVTIEKSELSSDFTLKKTEESLTADKVSQLSLPINLQSSNVDFFVLANDSISCIAGRDKAAALLGADNYAAAGDINVNCVLQKGSLITLDCNYATSSQRSVTINVSCEY